MLHLTLILLSQLSKLTGLCLNFPSLDYSLETFPGQYTVAVIGLIFLFPFFQGSLSSCLLWHVWKHTFTCFVQFFKVCVCWVLVIRGSVLFLLLFYGQKQRYIHNFYFSFSYILSRALRMQMSLSSLQSLLFSLHLSAIASCINLGFSENQNQEI